MEHVAFCDYWNGNPFALRVLFSTNPSGSTWNTTIGFSEHWDVGPYEKQPRYFKPERWYAEIDPLFPVTCRTHDSLGNICEAGHTVPSVAGDGALRRCHFIAAPIGNLYEPGFERNLRPAPCTKSIPLVASCLMTVAILWTYWLAPVGLA